MDIEQIIKRVAEEVYAQIRAEEKSGSGAGMTGGGQTILSRMQPDMRMEDVKKACDDAKAGRVGALCIPQWFVPFAVEQLKGSGVKVATAVGLPGGSTSSFAKYAEVKQAVVSGAEAILIPVNMQLCAVADWGSAKNDLAESMVPCKGKALVYAMLEVDQLSCDQLSTAAEMCAACGVDMVLLSAVVGGKVSDAQVQAVKQKACVGVYGGVTQSSKAGYQQAGATCFAASAV